jgi:pyrroline-5-carboxylate reductase
MDGALTIGVIGGAGWLGSAMAQSMLDAGLIAPDRLALSYRRTIPTRFPSAYVTHDNQDLVDRSDVVILSVRPEDWPSITISANSKLVVSVVTGVALASLAERLQTRRIIRAMPNAAAEVGKSYTPWIGTEQMTQADRSIAGRIFAACGVSDEVRSEAELDYFTGLSGTGPAFPALLGAAMIKDAIGRGVDPEVARRAVTAVLIGSGRLLERHGENPINIVETFVQYRGVTTAAIEAMQIAGFDAAVASGLSAALERLAKARDLS